MANEAWQITAPGKLTLGKLGEIPNPGPKQALVRIHANSLNFRDLIIKDHDPSYPIPAAPGLIPCGDAAGVVEQAGPGSVFKQGDKTNTWADGDSRNYKFEEFLGGATTHGTLRRWMVVDDQWLLRAPKNLTMEEASTIFIAGVTAGRALFFSASPVGPGSTLLTQGTGGVSCWAIQLARAAGATVIATSSSDEKLAIAKDLGATHLINYRTTPDWASEVLKLTDGKGVDHVLDVGGAGTIEQSLKAVRRAGLVTLVGILTESKKTDLVQAILWENKTVTGNMGAGNKRHYDYTAAVIEKHDIHPPIAKVFEFEEAEQAYEELKTFKGVGKVVIRC